MLNEKDLSWIEDLSMGISDLISIEGHSQQSYLTSKNELFLRLINDIRKIRTRWMQVVRDELKYDTKNFLEDCSVLIGAYYMLLEKNKENDQSWCIEKHLLSGYMRCTEVSNKFLEINDFPERNKDGFLNYFKKGIKLIGGDKYEKENI